MPFLSPLMGRQFLLELVKQLAPLRGVSAGVGECGVQRSLAVVALAQGFKNIGGVGHGAAVWGMWGCYKGAVGYLRTLRAAPTPMPASTTNTPAMNRNSTEGPSAAPSVRAGGGFRRGPLAGSGEAPKRKAARRSVAALEVGRL